MRSKRWMASLGVAGFAACYWVAAHAETVSVALKAVAKVEDSRVVKPDPIVGPRRCRPVDVVICLDTSGSMTALIDSARGKLWDIVNTLAQEEPNAVLRVGLLTYGTPGRSDAARGWVARQTGLTSDLDTVYAKMMALTTNGGDEFVGWVLNDALRTMNWSNHPEASKLVFVAGNESADQAAHAFNFRRVAQEARGQGIVINSIYGGGYQQGIAELWDQVALHGGGYFSAIDMQAGTRQITTPHDKLLIELNAEINATYVPFGSAGARGKANQVQQDANASRMGQQSISSRAATKSTRLYSNAKWDLIDASEEADFDLSKVKLADLPAPMQTMTEVEQRKYLEKKKVTRASVQRRIQEVNEKREDHIRSKRAKSGNTAQTLDDAMKEAIRKQVGKK